MRAGRPSSPCLIAAAVAAALISAGVPQARADDRPAGTNRVVATHGAWRVVVAETDRGKLCYAAGTPALRLPKDVSAAGAFVFVTTRPDDQVRDEVAVEFGFTPAEAELQVGPDTFPLATLGDGAWIRERGDEMRLVDAMRSDPHMTLRATRAGGKDVVDSYVLDGFAAALAQARRECADSALSN